MFEGKKITKATFKSFLKKNSGKLYIRTKSHFDGMTDCVEQCADQGWSKITDAEYKHENNLGIQGVWLVGGSRDYFTAYNDGKFSGIDVYNCCGHFMVGVRA